MTERKRLVYIDPSTSKRRTVATYTLEGDEVHVELAEPAMRRFFTAQIVRFDRVLEPKDGRRYFDALDKAYDQSSFAVIERA